MANKLFPNLDVDETTIRINRSVAEGVCQVTALDFGVGMSFRVSSNKDLLKLAEKLHEETAKGNPKPEKEAVTNDD